MRQVKSLKQALKKTSFTVKEAIKLAYRVRPGWFVLAVVLNSLWGLFDIPLLLISKQLIDAVIEAIKSPDWRPFTSVIFWLLIAQGGLELLRQFISRSARGINFLLTRRIDAQMEMEIGKKHSQLDIPRIENPKFRDVYDRIERESSRRIWGLVRPIFDVFQSLVGLISNLMIIAFFAPWVVLLVVLLTIPTMVTNISMTQKEYHLREEMSKKYRVWGWLSNYLKGGNTNYEIRIFHLFETFAEKIENLLTGLFNKRENLEFKWIGWETLAGLPEKFFTVGFNIFVFFQALAQVITLGYAQMLVRAVSGMQNYMWQLSRSLTEIYQNQLYVKELIWFLNLKPKTHTKNTPVNLPLRKGIEFQNVWFKYPHSKEWVLRNVNLKIGLEENVALVGQNGAGKTTLIKLLCGFYRPQKGNIFVNGVSIYDYDLHAYRKLLSVLFQDFEQYPFSAAESIGYGDVSKINNMEEIKNTAKLTKINEFIEGLPHGYKNPISKKLEEGIEPSKGQWQRIALARALFKKAAILILDEPTSNVDPKSEEEIFEDLLNINRKHMIILISHRFSTVRKADKIFVLNKGCLTESGRHDELIKNKGMYAELFTAQAKGYK